MNVDDPLKIMRQCNALITDSHIVLKSGDHSADYVDPDRLFLHPLVNHQLSSALARHFSCDNVDTVIGPVTGGTILSTWVAHYLTDLTGHETLGTYAKEIISSIVWFDDDPKSPRYGHKFVIEPVFHDFITHKRVLVVDDILTTGTTARQVIQAVRELNGNVMGLGVLVNRGGLTEKMLSEIPKLVSLVDLPLETWTEQNCLLCKQDIPISEEISHGREFLAKKGIRTHAKR